MRHLAECNVAYDRRNLNIGDFLWIARERVQSIPGLLLCPCFLLVDSEFWLSEYTLNMKLNHMIIQLQDINKEIMENLFWCLAVHDYYMTNPREMHIFRPISAAGPARTGFALHRGEKTIRLEKKKGK